jgi:hypothetical protein
MPAQSATPGSSAVAGNAQKPSTAASPILTATTQVLTLIFGHKA